MSTQRLHIVQIQAQVVGYDEHGRATAEGSTQLEQIVLLEAEIPPALVAVIKARFPGLSLTVIEPPSGEDRGGKKP